MSTNARILLCTLFLAGFWACSDDSENVNDDLTSEDVGNITAVDEATTSYSDAVTISNQILSEEQIVTGRTQQCYTVSEALSENELLVTFESECQGFDGKTRSGSFLIEWDGSLQTNDFSYSLTFDGYEVNGYGLLGSITVSNHTFKENGFGFNVVVTDGVVNCPDGKQINYEQDFDYDITLGEISEIRITGSCTGMSKQGVTYVANIQEPILVISGCDHPVSGSFEATFNGRASLTMDYGDGSCDDQAMASRGDKSLAIEL